MTHWTIFSACRKVHFPVCRWYCVATAYIKHCVNKDTTGWDDETNNTLLRSMLMETLTRILQDFPVRGNWCINGCEFTVWVDTSWLATEATREANRSVVKDVSWLHPANNEQHINLAELNAVLKGVNLALLWLVRVLHIRTDSASVYQWTSDALTEKVQLTAKAASEMLLWKQLRTLESTTAVVE